MPCFYPLHGFRSRERTESGKRKIVFSTHTGYVDLPVELPCGRCVGCRLERSRQWAVRIMHESQAHDENCVVTLTYDEAHLPVDRSLDKNHFRQFMKRLRARFPSKQIRYFVSGEYGDDKGRPHYHAIIFGFDFEDKEFFKTSPGGDRLYTSRLLDSCWKRGQCLIGTLSWESAQYVAKYCLKKITGEMASDHYKRVDQDTGEVYWLAPEFGNMSLKPGIGIRWLERYFSDVFPADRVIINGTTAIPPRAYLKHWEKFDEAAVKKALLRRVKKNLKHKADQTPARLRVRELVVKARLNLCKP